MPEIDEFFKMSKDVVRKIDCDSLTTFKAASVIATALRNTHNKAFLEGYKEGVKEGRDPAY